VQERKDRNHIGENYDYTCKMFYMWKIIGDAFEEYTKRYEIYKKRWTLVESKETPKQILDDLGVDRYCCRRMILTHVELIGESAPYE